jgi:hypothetical protein
MYNREEVRQLAIEELRKIWHNDPSYMHFYNCILENEKLDVLVEKYDGTNLPESVSITGSGSFVFKQLK